MRPTFDIFITTGGHAQYVETVRNLAAARKRLKKLAHNASGDCFLYSIEDGIVELAFGHLFGIDELFAQFQELEGAQEVAGLVEGAVAAAEGAADFGDGVFAFAADFVDHEIDAFLRGPVAKVEVE